MSLIAEAPASPRIDAGAKTWRADCCLTLDDLDAASDESWAIANRLAIGLLLGMMVMLVSFTLYTEFVRVELLGLDARADDGSIFFFKLLMFLAATPTVALLGWPIARNSWRALRQRRLSADSLIFLGSLSAYVVSVYSLFGGGEVYFDTATLILLLVTAGHFLEIRAQIKSSEALEALLARAPDEATVVRAGDEVRVPAGSVVRGERVVVRPGETFPVDGRVLHGEGSVNEANVTGEARPVFKEAGQPVYSGTASLDGYFVLEATGVGEERVIARLIRLLLEARQRRAPIQRLADRVATVFVPAAMAIGLATFLYWSRQSGPAAGLLHGLSVLLIACPCALGLATPLAIWAGLNRAAAEGILIRHGEALENLSRVRHMFFDKTGTLTRGSLSFSRIVLAAEPGLTETGLLARAAGLESASEHPLGRAIVAEARRRGLAWPAPEQVTVSPGLGIQGVLAGLPSPTAAGSARFVARLGWALPACLQARMSALEAAGQTVICCGWDGAVKGLLVLTETVRPEAAQALAALRREGVALTVLTGDSQAAGAALGERLGVAVVSQLLPQDKVSQVTQARGAGGLVAMVGDGLNDAPALAAADVGFALGCGVDVTREAADVSLLGDDVGQVAWAWSLARATYRRIRWNLVWAFFYNVIGIGLAAMGLLHPILSALAMVLSNLMVVGNSMGLYRFGADGSQVAGRRVTGSAVAGSSVTGRTAEL